jgi:hypothetical protein
MDTFLAKPGELAPFLAAERERIGAEALSLL